MNYLLYQQALTHSINLLIVALLTLLALQWGLGIKQQQPPGKRFSLLGWQPWWVKIRTTNPRCTYYFGPFPFRWIAQRHQGGYREDLALEKPQGIDMAILQDTPRQLTRLEEFD